MSIIKSFSISFIWIIFIGLFCLFLNSCADKTLEWEAQGGILATEGTYIVIQYTDTNDITDCYILKNSFIKPIYHIGWLFEDNKGNHIMVSGTFKIIRVIEENETEMLQKYHNYHREFEKLSYQEKFEKNM